MNGNCRTHSSQERTEGSIRHTSSLGRAERKKVKVESRGADLIRRQWADTGQTLMQRWKTGRRLVIYISQEGVDFRVVVMLNHSIQIIAWSLLGTFGRTLTESTRPPKNALATPRKSPSPSWNGSSKPAAIPATWCSIPSAVAARGRKARAQMDRHRHHATRQFAHQEPPARHLR